MNGQIKMNSWLERMQIGEDHTAFINVETALPDLYKIC